MSTKRGKERMGRAKRFWVTFFFFALLCAAMALRLAANAPSGFAAAPLLRNAIHIGLLTAWCICVRRRVMQPQALRLLTAIAGLMLFWFSVRLLKYEFVEDAALSRYLWYLYYLPMLFIPLCALLTALLLGKPESARLPGGAGIPAGISAVLFLLVMTNDLHQLVFRFPGGKPWSDSDYGYGPVYSLIVVWLLLCGLAFLVLLLLKCRIPESRKFIWLPAVPVALLAVYTALYLLRVRWLFVLFGDLPVAFCLCYGAILEGCMQAGLIQTNTGYDTLFAAATIRAQITDERWHTRYHSGSAPLDAGTLARAENAPVQLDRSTLLKTSRIRGGHVAWQEDVTELADTLERLAENQRELEDETYLEQEALRTRQEMLRLKEKNRLYDLIGSFTRPQIALLDTLLREYDRAESGQSRRALLAKSCVVGAYLKRCGNLLLLREGGGTIPIAELARAVAESLQNLELTGAQCGLTCAADVQLPADAAVEAYARFQQLLEAMPDVLSCLWVNLRIKDGALLLHLEAEPAAALSLPVPGGEQRTEDGVTRLTLRFPLGGDGAC